ncbi:MAG: WD40 repeat domain-containing protein [Deltaproteobacteria bacterium]|nr:WD40 repeat domain-containing protein [Deltaproteobacteria bacterium]
MWLRYCAIGWVRARRRDGERKGQGDKMSEGTMAVNSELEALQHVLADPAHGYFFDRWRAVWRLTQLAHTSNGASPPLSNTDARAVIDGLVAGLEGVHWGVHRRCKRVLETLQHQPLIDAVCDLLIERGVLQLRDIAVSAHYEPQDPPRKAAYLFVLGRQQFYEAHDPDGTLLERFQLQAAAPARGHLLRLARERGEERWTATLLKTLKIRNGAELSTAELDAALEILPPRQEWDTLWALVQTSPLPWSWQATRQLVAAHWQPTEARAAACWADLVATVAQVDDPTTVEHFVSQERAVLRGHANWVRSVAFSPDGTTLASGSSDCTIRLWNVAQGQERTVLRGHTLWVRSVAFSPDGTTLASGSGDSTIRLWDVASGRVRNVLQGHTDPVAFVAFSPDGTTLASGGRDHTVRLWDIARGQERAVLQGHTDTVAAVAFSPDGTTLTSGSFDHTVRLWDVARRQERAVLRGHTNRVAFVAFSPDGTTLASGSFDHTVRLWDVARRQERAVLRGHADWVLSVVFKIDGTTLVSGSRDHTVRLWDVARRQEWAVLQGHTDAVESVAFSLDGTTLASGSADHTVRLWEVWDDATTHHWHRWTSIPLGQLTDDDYTLARRVSPSASAEQQAVARYVAAVLRYRLGDGATG